MAETGIPRRAGHAPAGMYVLSAGTLAAAALAVLVAQVGFAVPAVLNGLFQQTDPRTLTEQEAAS